MKTAEEFVKEINKSEELQKALREIKDKTALEEFLKENGCGAAADEFAALVSSQNEGEISEDEAAGAAGGIGRQYYWEDGRPLSGEAPVSGQTVV